MTYFIALTNNGNVLVIGRTGTGKSSLCVKMAQECGVKEWPFQVSDGVFSSIHSHGPIELCLAGGGKIIDTPGLLDSQGDKQDETNIQMIVQKARQLGQVNGFVLVLNEQDPRFDSGMASAVKLLVDSFGMDCLRNMCFLYTRADGTISVEEARRKTRDILTILAGRFGERIESFPPIPTYQIQCFPEKYRNQWLPAFIESITHSSKIAIQDMIRWSNANPPVNTSNAIAGMYDHERKLLEQREKAERERQEEIERIRKTPVRITCGHCGGDGRCKGPGSRPGNRCCGYGVCNACGNKGYNMVLVNANYGK